MPHAGLVALVVDDEAPALADLSYLLGEDDRVAEVLCASSGTEALGLLDDRSDVDVVFSDISMPGLDGMALARVLSRFTVRPQVVFVTAHDEHAVDAFALDVTDYVMKPVRRERLAEAVRRVVAARSESVPDHASRPGHLPPSGMPRTSPHVPDPPLDQASGPLPARPLPARPEPSGRGPEPSGRGPEPSGRGPVPSGRGPEPEALDETIPVELGGVTRFITRSQIRYAQAHGDYARLHTDSGSHLVRVPLSVLEETWREHGFVRIHRSTLVALPHVTEVRMDRGRCSVVVGEVELQVSRRHTKLLRDTLLRRPIGDRRGGERKPRP